ncbi:MAG: hypothetical protein VW729_07880, partial [Deltaproteobacteria bacterium]
MTLPSAEMRSESTMTPGPATEPRHGQQPGIHWVGETGSSERATRGSSEFQTTWEVVVISSDEISTSHN